MKKRSILVSLLTFAALISCGGGENPSNNEIPMSHGSTSEVNESNFPSEDIKAFFNTDKEPITFGGENFYHEGVNEEGNKCYLVYCEKNEEASNDYFNSYLPTIGFEVTQESDYYFAISNDNPYMLLYFESLQDGVTYFVVQYYFDDSFSGNDENFDYTKLSEFPANEISAYLNVNALVPSFEADEYYYFEGDILGYYFVSIYSTKSSTACNDAYKVVLESSNYIVEYVEDLENGSYYVAINANDGYEIYFYEVENEFYLEIYVYEEQSGGNVDSEYDEEYILSYSFPNNVIQEFFNTDSTLVSYDADEYYYARTYDSEGYDYIYIYSTKSSTACNTSYKSALENASYVIEECEDEYGIYYYAYNDNTGFELIFFEDDEYGTFDIQVYYYGDSGNNGDDVTSEDNTSSENNPLQEAIEITSIHWDQSGYVEKEFSVNGFTFYSERVMLSTNVDYKGAMQFSSSTKGAGTIYNVDPISEALTIEIDLNYSANFDMKVYVSNSSNGQFVEANMTTSGSIYSYDVKGYSFFKIVNESDKACYIDTITIK